MATCKVNLKLLIDTKSNKVLFAEAGKDFIDFLFNLLSLPLGNVINLLAKNSMVGSLGNVYESMETLSEAYLQPKSKDAILKPKTPASATSHPLLLSSTVKSVSVNKFYMYQYYHQNVADDPRVSCPQCQYLMSVNVPYIFLQLWQKKHCSMMS